MQSYWVYMVLCGDASYYTGITNNVDIRVGQHNEGVDRHSYTFTRRPVQLVYTAEFYDPNEAIAWEKQIKGWSRKKKDALVRGDWVYIKKLARE
jgi:putative endonuclease